MKELFKASEWQGGSGLYYVNDTTHMTAWWVHPRVLGISPAAYVELLVKKYNVSNIKYFEESGFLYFGFRTLADARRYKNDINKKARERKFYI